MDDFVRSLATIDWSLLMDRHLSLDEKTDTFHGVLHDAFLQTIPSEEVILTGNEKPWVTPHKAFGE